MMGSRWQMIFRPVNHCPEHQYHQSGPSSVSIAWQKTHCDISRWLLLVATPIWHKTTERHSHAQSSCPVAPGCKQDTPCHGQWHPVRITSRCQDETCWNHESQEDYEGFVAAHNSCLTWESQFFLSQFFMQPNTSPVDVGTRTRIPGRLLMKRPRSTAASHSSAPERWSTLLGAMAWRTFRMEKHGAPINLWSPSIHIWIYIVDFTNE